MTEAAAPTPNPNASIEDFAKLQFRVAEILSVEEHPNADKLYVLKVKVGPGENDVRQLVAGIRAHREKDTLIGKRIIMVANLEPAKLRGVESQGMLLAAGGKGGEPFALLTVDADVPPGTRIS